MEFRPVGADSSVRMYGRTDMKLVAGFRNSANAPTKCLNPFLQLLFYVHVCCPPCTIFDAMYSTIDTTLVLYTSSGVSHVFSIPPRVSLRVSVYLFENEISYLT
jgi:hypothetical protein